VTYADVPGARLWYTDSGGSGVPVVLLHARSGTTESWVCQVPAFQSAGYRCIAFDRRDAGKSQPASTGEQPGCGSEDLLALITHLDLTPFHLVSTAAGGVVALDFALTHPNLVRSLVLADSIGGPQDREYLEVQERLRPTEVQALPVEVRELSAGYRGTNPEGARRWLEIEHASRWDETAPPQTRHNALTLSLVETLRSPTLVIAGDADLLTPPAMMRILAAHIHDHQFVTVPEAGHAAFWEQPEIWNQLVLEFIRAR
jgi:pimeloyl-ACP methyl ester carboxylesterase